MGLMCADGEARWGGGTGFKLSGTREEVETKDSEDEEDKGEERANVEERREGEDHRDDEVAQLLGTLEQPQDAQDAQDAQHAQQHRRQREDLVEQLGGKLVEEGRAHEEEVEATPVVCEVAFASKGGELEHALDVVDDPEGEHRAVVVGEHRLVSLNLPIVGGHHANVGDDHRGDKPVERVRVDQVVGCAADTVLGCA